MTAPFQTLEEIIEYTNKHWNLFESVYGKTYSVDAKYAMDDFKLLSDRLLATAETKELVEKGKHQSRIEELEAKLSKVREGLEKLEYFDELEVQKFTFSYDWVKKMDVDAILKELQ